MTDKINTETDVSLHSIVTERHNKMKQAIYTAQRI